MLASLVLSARLVTVKLTVLSPSTAGSLTFPSLMSNVFLRILLAVFLLVLRVIVVPSGEILKPSVLSSACLLFTRVFEVKLAPVTVIWYTPESVAVTFTVASISSSFVKPASAFPPAPGF